MTEKTKPGLCPTEGMYPPPPTGSGRESSARFCPSVTRQLYAFLSVAVVMACLFPGLSAQAQSPTLPFQADKIFVADRSGSVLLPAATGGAGSYSYSLVIKPNRNLRNGLSFNPDTRELSANVPDHRQWEGTTASCGTGGVICQQQTLVYRVTDANGAADEVEFRGDIHDYPSMFLPAENDLQFTPNRAITSVTFRQTDDRSTSYTYALTGPNGTDLSELPGLDFDSASRTLSGTPTAEGTKTVTYTATHSNTAFTPTLVHTVTFDITVSDIALPSQPDLAFVANRLGKVTLPAATRGTASYTYSLTLPSDQPVWNGLSFNPATRELSANVPDHEEWEGMKEDPCEIEGVVCLQSRPRYRVTDRAGSTITRSIRVNIYDFPPEFLPAQDDLHFTPGTAITPVTLRPPPGRSGAYTYTLTGPNGTDLSEVPGLTFDPDTRVLSGTPTAEGATTVTYSATNDLFTPDLVFTVTFDITVAELALPAQDDLVYNEGTAIDPVTLPAATGGTPPHTYDLTGPNGADLSEVPGLTFDPATRILSGTPTAEGATTLTYTITDSAATPGSVTRTFTVTVTEPISVAEVTDRTYATGEALTLTLPEATGGTSPHAYALTGPNGTDLSEVPGLTFDPATRVLSGTPTKEGETTLTYTVTDSATTPASVTRTFTVTVTGPISLAEVEDQTYAAGEALTLTLPAATDGTEPYTYALTGPNGRDLSEVPGLTFDPATRVLSGAPTRAGATALTYTVTDSATTPASVTRTFTVTVTGPISLAEVEDRPTRPARPSP